MAMDFNAANNFLRSKSGYLHLTFYHMDDRSSRALAAPAGWINTETTIKYHMGSQFFEGCNLDCGSNEISTTCDVCGEPLHFTVKTVEIALMSSTEYAGISKKIQNTIAKSSWRSLRGPGCYWGSMFMIVGLAIMGLGPAAFGGGPPLWLTASSLATLALCAIIHLVAERRRVSRERQYILSNDTFVVFDCKCTPTLQKSVIMPPHSVHPRSA